MTVRELYERICERIPEHLSEEWDNDGIMCCPDEVADVERVLITLDVTEEIVDYAADNGFDLIVSHHPLIFRPLSSVDCDNHISRKLIKLITCKAGKAIGNSTAVAGKGKNNNTYNNFRKSAEYFLNIEFRTRSENCFFGIGTCIFD